MIYADLALWHFWLSRRSCICCFLAVSCVATVCSITVPMYACSQLPSRAASTLKWSWVIALYYYMFSLYCLTSIVLFCVLQDCAGLQRAAQFHTCVCRSLFYNWFWKYMSIVVIWHGFSNWIIFGWYFLMDVGLVCKWSLCHLSRPCFGIMYILP